MEKTTKTVCFVLPHTFNFSLQRILLFVENFLPEDTSLLFSDRSTVLRPNNLQKESKNENWEKDQKLGESLSIKIKREETKKPKKAGKINAFSFFVCVRMF